MDFLIQRDELIRALSRANGIAEKSASNAIASAALLQATEGGLRVTATDKAMTCVGTFAANVNTTGEVAVNVANFLQVAKVLPNDVVSIRLGDNNRIDVRCAKSTYKLAGHAAADFPPAPSFDMDGKIVVDAAVLRRIVDQTCFSIAPDDNRYGLNGAHMATENTPAGRVLRMVGTDGNRLSYAQGPFTGTLTIGRRNLLPRKPLSELRKLIDGLSGPVEIGFSDRAAVVQFEGTTLHMRLTEAEFPNYKEVLPTAFKRTVIVDRATFMESLRRVLVFAKDGSKSVRFAFTDGSCVLTARKLDAGDAREDMEVDLRGESITMGFNGMFLAEILAAITTTRVTLSLGDMLSPCIIDGVGEDNCRHVIMPVRLD